MFPSCNKLLFFLLWITTYGNTLTISSTVNRTDLDSGTLTHVTGLTINSSCETTHQCSGKLVCVNGQCQCSENHVWNGTNCIEEKTLQSKCKHTTECETTLFCIYGTCQCAQMHYWNGNICVAGKTYNNTCEYSNECSGKLLCKDGVCQCPLELYWNGKQCLLKKSDGHSCGSSIECTENLECTESQCQCSESEYWDVSFCYPKKSVNDACRKEDECGTTLYCARSVCQCAASDYWSGSTCYIKRNMTSQCRESSQCEETLHCIRGTCKCDVHEYWTQGACTKNSCAFEHCLNGGTCRIAGDGHRCVCVDGYLGEKCQYSDGRAKDFIVIFHEAYVYQPRILTTVNTRVHLSVFYFANNKNISVIVKPADNHFVLDSNVVMANGLHQAGAEIHSDVPITIYGFIFRRHYSEGFFVVPTQFLSTDYIIPSFTAYNSVSYSLFSLSPVYSGTVIEIMFKMTDGSISYDNIQYSNNQTLTLVLNKYTSFQIRHSSDLTGTRIIASKPVVVVSGNRYNNINGMTSKHPFIEMALPTNQLDNVYVIPYLNYRLQNTVRVLAVNDSNVVTLANVNKRSSKVLNSREFFDYVHTTISYVSSESDVIVNIYPHELIGNFGDAIMMTIPGINQYLYDYDFMVPTDFESFISITVPTKAAGGFVLDGNFVNLKNIFSISEDKYQFSSFSIPISSGIHHIIHREHTPFGLWVYGNYSSFDAYGYSAGMAFKTSNNR